MLGDTSAGSDDRAVSDASLASKYRMEAKHTLGEPRVLISRSALLHNVGIIRSVLQPQTKICAILKADAYGHGGQIVLDALSNFSHGAIEAPAVDLVAVACIDEAIELRSNSTLPLVIFRPVENSFLGRQRERLELAIRSGWTLTLCSPAAADDLARIAHACGRRASVQVMVDTGMSRSGACMHQLDALLQKIESRPALRLTGICTHFASADDPHNDFTIQQFVRFRAGTDHLVRQGSAKLLRHTANSGAIFFHPTTHLDAVRPGISLYGIDPTGRPSVDRHLRPVMKWTAPLVHIRDVARGSYVGYGQTWQASRDTRIGLVPVGYADGYLRAFSNRAVMMLHGKPLPVVGRVSMDMTTVDLGEVPHAGIGDEITVLDNDPLSPANAYKLAELADTIPYEIFCRIGQRVQRVAVDPIESTSAIEPPPRRAAQHDPDARGSSDVTASR